MRAELCQMFNILNSGIYIRSWMSSAKQSGTVLWMCVQIIAEVVIKAGTHGREQTNICFPYKPPFTILGFSDRVSFQQSEPTSREERGVGYLFQNYWAR